MLASFSVIVSTDCNNGISKDGEIQTQSQSTSNHFKELTCGKRNNAIIMGRITYESIPEDKRPLPGRKNVVISRTWKQEDHPEIIIYSSFLEALEGIGNQPKAYDDVFVMGGEQIFHTAICDFGYLCKKVYVTKFKADFDCDQFFPWDAVKEWKLFCDIYKTRDFNRFTFIAPQNTHQEEGYLDLLRDILSNGESKTDRTQVGIISSFGKNLSFDISERIPILTTKKVNHESIIKELLFFISGKTDTNILSQQSVKIWEGNTSRKFLDERGLVDYEVGDMGPMYGHQWRHWGADYEGCNASHDGIDQLSNIINEIRTNPHSRRLVLSAWNVQQLPLMVLAPCHCMVQFNVSGDKKWLDCLLFQRSADMFLGVPYNIASYAFLTYMIAHITGLRPRKLNIAFGDAHIYQNHIDQVKKQLSRTPRPFPKLKFRGAAKLKEIDDFKLDNFVIEDYVSCPAITAKMAV